MATIEAQEGHRLPPWDKWRCPEPGDAPPALRPGEQVAERTASTRAQARMREAAAGQATSTPAPAAHGPAAPTTVGVVPSEGVVPENTVAIECTGLDFSYPGIDGQPLPGVPPVVSNCNLRWATLPMATTAALSLGPQHRPSDLSYQIPHRGSPVPRDRPSAPSSLAAVCPPGACAS